MDVTPTTTQPLEGENVARKRVLNIFDYDGTLFKSPLPNSRIWNSEMVAKLKATPKEKGLGWFQEPITLSPPYVPADPGPEWWNLPLLEIAKESMSHPDYVTVLLTGRSTEYNDILKTLTGHVGLVFDEVGLKPTAAEEVLRTMDFKQAFILRLIEKYSPLSKVQLWEDRPDHVKKFTDFFAELSLKHTDTQFIVHEADAGDTILAEPLEREVVDFLMKKHAPEFELKTVVEYTGVFLDRASKQKLMEGIFHPMVKELERRKKVKEEAKVAAGGEAEYPITPATTTTPTSPNLVLPTHNNNDNNNGEQEKEKEKGNLEKEGKNEKENDDKEKEKEKETDEESKKEKGKEKGKDHGKASYEEKQRKKKEIEDAIALEDLTWAPKCHHMTMTLNAINEKTFAGKTVDPALYAIGRKCELTVVAFGISKRAMAVKVETDVPTVNTLPHVTVGVSIIGKAKDSNDITDWTPITLEEGSEEEPTTKEEGGMPTLRRFKLTGMIKEWLSTGLSKPPPPPRLEVKLNYGKLLKQYHPTISGPQIGKAVKTIKEWAETNGVTTESEVEEYVKNMTL